MTTFQEALDFVSTATEQEVRLLFDAGNRRAKTIRANQAAANAATLTVGSKVRTKGLKPKYLSGLPGTVTRVDGSKISIEVDESHQFETGRYSRNFTVPASALEAI
jgi:preprotein translocase subunit YajC